MTKRLTPAALGVVAGVVVFGLFLTAGARRQIDGPPVGHTGGFGEPTCAACHLGSPLNEPGSTLEVIGLGTSYQPDAKYRLTVRLRSYDMLVAGFQATLRWNDGPRRGASAGELAAVDERVAVLSDEAGRIQYVQHTSSGTKAGQEVAEWVFDWSAPEEHGSVVLHVAANSGNGDNSPLEDLIYTKQMSLNADDGR